MAGYILAHKSLGAWVCLNFELIMYTYFDIPFGVRATSCKTLKTHHNSSSHLANVPLGKKLHGSCCIAAGDLTLGGALQIFTIGHCRASSNPYQGIADGQTDGNLHSIQVCQQVKARAIQ